MDPMHDFMIQLIPILLIWLVFALPLYKIARRKGGSTRGIILGLVIGLFPIAMFVFGIWWASLPDKALSDRISQLEDRQGP